MRMRFIWAVPTAFLTGAALVLPLGAAQAAPTRPAVKVVPRRSAAVTLPTGDHVRLTGPKGRERVLVQPSEAGGPGRNMIAHRLNGHTYVLPAVAEPYLGRFLDKSLFDVTGLTARLRKDGRL